MSAKITVKYSQEDMSAFASLCGDYNPVHIDGDYARQHGFNGHIVYGGLMLGSVFRFLAQELPGPDLVCHSVKMDFHAPLYPDEEAQLVGEVTYWSQEHRVIKIALTMSRDGKCLARGSAQTQVLVKNAGHPGSSPASRS